MIVTAATSAAAGTNQHPPGADLAPSPCCARGLHSVARDTEPRKTCPRVRRICNSAIMKREFVQPCARPNSEFTSPPSPKKHVPVRQEQDKKNLRRRRRRRRERDKKEKEEREREREREEEEEEEEEEETHGIIENTQNHQQVSFLSQR